MPRMGGNGQLRSHNHEVTVAGRLEGGSSDLSVRHSADDGLRRLGLVVARAALQLES